MNNRRLLVVDDHPINRRLPGMLLRDTGWQCFEADSGQAALDALREAPYDCVLLDISMPVMSGTDVCRIIKASAALKHLRVVAYTAHAMEDAQNSILQSGFDAILIKPINRGNLLAALEPDSAKPAP
ncbi:MAG: response regulator [Burkholderiales bacterium]|jgi:CheY-like chemotaxis protein